ncbi:MAG: DNA mismatch repair protein MutL [Chloroflexi bacterium]|nr:DNA mismatch repair protein MutL [Chloroflexota bacterium]
MSIKVLCPNVISKIAAGEIVERPASVVKELVENSLDAGATQITVEVGGGGIGLIRVTDNGVGIPADEVELAFERHATGKITSEIDLEAVSSLGFRGEALPSIAAVAEVSMVTRYRDDVVGTAIKLENGAITSKGKQGCPRGTAVTIRDLFRNVPARLKFLKSPSTENGHISHLVTQFSLAFPEVKFNLIINGRTSFRSPGNGSLRDVLVEVYGLETAQAMLEIESSETVCPAVNGFISPSSLSRSNRNYLSFFVNRRRVQSRMLTYAVEEAYQGMLMTGKHPIVAINISLPPQEIDVNVHPTKSEIRFRSERHVFVAVQKAVRNALVGSAPLPSTRISPLPPSASTSPLFVTPPGHKATSLPQLAQKREGPESGPQLPILRVIGQFQNAYIVAEGPDGMYLIEQHAAHERVLFEKTREQQASRAIEVQGLLEPMAIEVTAQQQELLQSQQGVLYESGFYLEQFGERTYLLRSVPAVLKKQDITRVLAEILDSLGGLQKSEWQEGVAVSLACHGAIPTGQSLSFQEMEELVHQLEQTQSPRTCPHGRPTIIHINASQLERGFGRRGAHSFAMRSSTRLSSSSCFTGF